MSAILKQKLIDIANGFTKYGLWKGGGSGGSSALSDMTDVTFNNLKENDVLKYNGSVWVNSDNLHEYSTEEKIVGKWIDGKNVYEKTIVKAINWSGDTLQRISHGISNIDRLVEWSTIINQYSIPYFGDRTFQLSYDSTYLIYKNNANWSNYTLYTTIRYTKTE